MRLISCFIFLLLFHLSWAQSIVNTEKLFRHSGEGFALAAELNGNFIAGNADVFVLEYSLNLAYKKKKSSLMLLSGGEYIQENKELVSNSLFGQIRYGYQLKPRTQVFGYFQLQSNAILLLQKRQLLGLGVKQNLVSIKKDSLEKFKFDLSLGVMQEEEQLNRNKIDSLDIDYSNYTRSSFSSVISWSPKENISFVNTTYYQARYANLSDFRLLNEINIILGLNKWLSFSIDIEYRFDSDPPIVLKDYDFSSKFGFLVNF